MNTEKGGWNYINCLFRGLHDRHDDDNNYDGDGDTDDNAHLWLQQT